MGAEGLARRRESINSLRSGSAATGWQPNRCRSVWQNRLMARRDGRTGSAPDGGLRAELAARLVVHSLPAAAATLPGGLSYRLELDGLGAWTVNPLGERAEVTEVPAAAI